MNTTTPRDYMDALEYQGAIIDVALLDRDAARLAARRQRRTIGAMLWRLCEFLGALTERA